MQTKIIFHWHNTSFNTGVVVQDNAAQQQWYSTTLIANTVSNTGKFAKMVHADFFGEDGGKGYHHSDLENQWLLVLGYDKDTSDQNGKPSTLPYWPFLLYSAYYYYFYSLLPTLIDARPQKYFQLKVDKKNHHLGSNVYHSSSIPQSYWYANDWLATRTIDIYESSIDNIIFNEPSSPNF